ncbi:hypothetical protein D3C72_1806630 [compost metagenome]
MSYLGILKADLILRIGAELGLQLQYVATLRQQSCGYGYLRALLGLRSRLRMEGIEWASVY